METSFPCEFLSSQNLSDIVTISINKLRQAQEGLAMESGTLVLEEVHDDNKLSISLTVWNKIDRLAFSIILL